MRFNLNSVKSRIIAWLYAMIIEHNVINLFRLNLHRISDEAVRSAQPTMWQLRRIVKKYHIKTILNLKGANQNSAYWAFEKEQCQKLGIKLVDIDIYGHSMPDAARIRHAKEIFNAIDYPIWIHCKAGADRSGIYATLYQYFHQNIPLEKTNQLKFWPFGHNKYSSAGSFDFYLAAYFNYQKDHPEIGLLEWAENISDRALIERKFNEQRIFNLISAKLKKKLQLLFASF